MLFREALIFHTEGPGRPSLKSVAEGAGVSYEQLKKVRQGKSNSTNADDAVKIASYFGLTVNEFLDHHLEAEREEIARLYRQLSPEERQILLDAARGRSAQDRGASG